MIGAGQDLETGLVLHHQLVQELAVEPVQVVDGVEQAVAAAHAEEERDLAEARLQVDDDRRPLAQARQLDGAVHRQRRRARAALGAEEHQRRRLPRAADDCRRAAARPIASSNGALGRRPGEELVGAGPHRLKDQLRARLGGDDEDARRTATPARSRSTAAHRRRHVAATVDDDEIRRRAVARQRVAAQR